MRDRYMGLFGVTWSIGFGIAPVIGGLLNDRVAPVATWYGGLVLGLVSTAGFLLLTRRFGTAEPAMEEQLIRAAGAGM